MNVLKRHSGFSLVESLLVLLCVSVFFMVPFITIKTWQSQLAIDQFFNQLERNMQLTQQSAITAAENTSISQVQSKGYFIFEYYHHSKKREEKLIVADGCVLRTNGIIKFNTTTGNIKELRTIKIEDHVNKQIVLYTFQLGSGKVIRSVKEL